MRLARERARERDSLLLASGEGQRPVARTIRKPDLIQRLKARLRCVTPHGESHIVDHPLPREQARILKHHRGVRRQAGEGFAIQPDCPGVGTVEPGHQPQQRALARAATADDADEAAPFDIQVEPTQYAAAAELLDNSGEAYARSGQWWMPGRRRGRRAFERLALGSDAGEEHGSYGSGLFWKLGCQARHLRSRARADASANLPKSA